MPVGLKNNYTGVDGWPCQRVSLYKDSKMASGSVKMLSWVMTHLGWQNHELEHFWGFWGFAAWMTRHRIGFRARTFPTAYCRKSLKEGKRKMSNWDGDWLEICCASQAQCRCKICCAFTTSVKCKMEPPFGFRLYITYRAILNMGYTNGSHKRDCRNSANV